MITKFVKYKLITEDPDNVWDEENGESYDIRDHEAMPFQCEVNDDHTEVEEILFGSRGAYHNDINDGESGAYPGRLWLDNKVIAFWVYPDDTLFKSIIRRIEDELDIIIFNNGWRIEVQKSKDKIKKKKFVGDDDEYYFQDGGWENATLIPVEEYAGSEDVDALQRQMHLMSWAEKQKLKEKGIKLAPGFGSDRIAWDQPRNLKYRQTIYQEKNDN